MKVPLASPLRDPKNYLNLMINEETKEIMKYRRPYSGTLENKEEEERQSDKMHTDLVDLEMSVCAHELLDFLLKNKD